MTVGGSAPTRPWEDAGLLRHSLSYTPRFAEGLRHSARHEKRPRDRTRAGRQTQHATAETRARRVGEGWRAEETAERLQDLSRCSRCGVAQSRPVTLGPRGLQQAGASLSLTVSQTSHEFTSTEPVIPFSRLTLSPSIAQHVHPFFNRYLPKF